MARTDQPHKVSFDAFVARVTDFSDPVNDKHRELDYSHPVTRDAWSGMKSKIPIWCNRHSEFFTQQAANHASGQGCPRCGKIEYSQKRRTSDPLAAFIAIHGDAYDYSRVRYVNTHTYIEVVCREHGPFRVKPHAHLKGSGCRQCWEDRRKALGKARTDDFKGTFAERAARVHAGAYAIIVAPADAHDTVKLNCPKHGGFIQKAYSHLDGHGCPGCGRSTPYAQQALAAFVESLGLVVEQDNRSVLGGLHIDIWIPEKRLGIEYHGQYWHTADRVGNKHRDKWERAAAAGVRLIQIFDFEDRAIVENRLRAMLGGTAVPARKCSVLAIPSASAFLDQHHSQGRGPHAAASYGLFLGDKMVACSTFGKGRFKSERWEVLRYASEGRVQGGFSKLFAAFLRDHSPTEVVSYCDLRWGDGRVYSASGFALDGITEPDYWYTDSRGVKRVSRYSAQKRPAGQSERDWAAEQGYSKVLGVGHQRWLWRDPQSCAKAASAQIS